MYRIGLLQAHCPPRSPNHTVTVSSQPAAAWQLMVQMCRDAETQSHKVEDGHPRGPELAKQPA